MFEVITISFAFVFGLAVRQIGLPPLVGFLAAGFAINLCSPLLGVPTYTGKTLEHVAHLGVLMLLFTVGLKLKIGQIAQPQVVGGALVHFALSVLLFMPGLKFLMGLDWNTALLMAIALSFSSTVLAAKLLETKRELGAFHGRTAIGILIVQDIIALAVLAIWSGQTPNIWALMLFGLPLLRPVLHRLLDIAGHDELLVLMGMLLSLVIGGMGFQAMGLSSEIGALVMGVLLSTHPRAKELGASLWSLKEIFLVGFFLQIGLTGLPDWGAMVFAIAAGIALALKGALFFALLVAFKLRARSAFLSALSLTAYSEFGLIVAAGVLPEYLVPLAIAVSISFVISAPLNRYAHPLYERYETRLRRYERDTIHPDEQPKNMGDADVLIFGMGRTGSAAYREMTEQGYKPLGLDADTYKAQAHRDAGRNVMFADAEDSNFWRSCSLGQIKAAILAMDDLEAKLIAARSLRQRGFTGPIVAHALHEAHLEQIREAGADYTYLTMNQAGINLAEQTAEAMASKG
ncbi:putative potassium efflux transporter [Roseobacter sp. AzwK-3b]|uniref:cation:proton antiporter family protein n=1 Tax=Roseobacter sp. AzwK-3b TaxID=351016 RepID=UPI0001569B92|nr:cation:proton antiporter family protein [Roseobacter sp. AzwK-3b]EDM72789.1 putative potassium efflux transporter [Roseobacter sp. AzwK-3b]